MLWVFLFVWRFLLFLFWLLVVFLFVLFCFLFKVAKHLESFLVLGQYHLIWHYSIHQCMFRPSARLVSAVAVLSPQVPKERGMFSREVKLSPTSPSPQDVPATAARFSSAGPKHLSILCNKIKPQWRVFSVGRQVSFYTWNTILYFHVFSKLLICEVSRTIPCIVCFNWIP